MNNKRLPYFASYGFSFSYLYRNNLIFLGFFQKNFLDCLGCGLVLLGYLCFSFYCCFYQHTSIGWYNMWKSRGGILVNIVPRKFQGIKPEGPQAPRVFGLATSRGTIFTRIPPRLFHILPFFNNPSLVTEILLQPILPLGSIVVNIPPWLLQYWQC